MLWIFITFRSIINDVKWNWIVVSKRRYCMSVGVWSGGVYFCPHNALFPMDSVRLANSINCMALILQINRSKMRPDNILFCSGSEGRPDEGRTVLQITLMVLSIVWISAYVHLLFWFRGETRWRTHCDSHHVDGLANSLDKHLYVHLSTILQQAILYYACM